MPWRKRLVPQHRRVLSNSFVAVRRGVQTSVCTGAQSAKKTPARPKVAAGACGGAPNHTHLTELRGPSASARWLTLLCQESGVRERLLRTSLMPNVRFAAVVRPRLSVTFAVNVTNFL